MRLTWLHNVLTGQIQHLYPGSIVGECTWNSGKGRELVRSSFGVCSSISSVLAQTMAGQNERELGHQCRLSLPQSAWVDNGNKSNVRLKGIRRIQH